MSELEQRRAVSSRLHVYERVLRHLDSARGLMGGPSEVAFAVADRTVPDAIWDRAVSAVTGL